MDVITYMQRSMMQQIPEMIESYEGDVSAGSLSEMEKAVKQMTHELGNEIMCQWLEAQEPKYADDHQDCPNCGDQATYGRRRKGMSITLQGRVYYRRAYYQCSSCHQGFYPLDEYLGIEAGQMSAEVVQLAALLGIEDAFGSSRDLLARTTLLELSPNSIRKATQQVGETVVAHEQALHERSHSFEAQREQQRSPDQPQRLYGSMDGFMVLLDDVVIMR